MGAGVDIASGCSNGEGAVGVDMVVAYVRVRLVEVRTGGDRPPGGEHFGDVVGKMLAHQPGMARDLPQESEGTVVVLEI